LPCGGVTAFPINEGHRRFLWPDITVQFSGDERDGKMVDGVAEGEVRSQTGKRGIFISVTTVLPASGRVEHPTETFFGGSGATFLPIKGAKTFKMARPTHNSGEIDDQIHEHCLVGAAMERT